MGEGKNLNNVDDWLSPNVSQTQSKGKIQTAQWLWRSESQKKRNLTYLNLPPIFYKTKALQHENIQSWNHNWSYPGYFNNLMWNSPNRLTNKSKHMLICPSNLFMRWKFLVTSNLADPLLRNQQSAKFHTNWMGCSHILTESSSPLQLFPI